MLKLAKTAIATAALAFAAAPAIAQDTPEEPRTTYRIEFLKFAPGADDRWVELLETYGNPASIAAGQKPAEVHWLMANNDWDVMLVNEMQGGMANLDAHANPYRARWMAEGAKIAGSEEAFAKLGQEYETLVEKQMTYFSHTHP